MQIEFAHLREKSTSGGWINFAVFNAKSNAGTDSANSQLLSELTVKARSTGLKIDQSALAYKHAGRIKYFGDKKLVDYLAKGWVPQWTHKLNP